MNGKEYFDSLSDNSKKNIISSFTGIRPEHVDLSGLEYHMLDRYTKKGLTEIARKKDIHAEHGMHKNLDGSTKNHHPNNLGKIPEWKF